MAWSRQLRWKLFISHAIIIVVAVIVLLLVAQALVGTSLGIQSPLLLGTNPQSIGELTRSETSTAVQGRFTNVLQQALTIAGICALIAAVIVSLFISRRIVEPLQELTQVSRRLALGYYRERTSIRSDDELAQLSQSINQLAETLDQTEQRRMSLLADVAHELRTPLTTIEGYMEGLLDGVIASDEHTFTIVRREAERLRRLTEELSLLSRVEAGAISINPRPTPADTLLHAIIARFQPQFMVCEVGFELILPPVAPLLLVDSDRITQVLTNLLANALRYTPTGGQVCVKLSHYDDYVQLSVCDTGVGITPDHLPYIFERFYRVDKSRGRSSGGTGIGLTIARYLVYAHGGDIWAESEGSGKGSIFNMTLPIYRPALEVQVVE